MRAKGDGMDEEILNVFGHLGLRALHLLGSKMQVILNAVILTEEEILVSVHKVLDVLIAVRRNGDNRRSLTRYSITHVSSFHPSEPRLIVSDGFFKKTEEKLNSVRTLEMNIAAGVPSLTAFYFHFQSDVSVFRLYRLISKCSLVINTSGTSDIKFALGLRIEVQQIFAFEPTALQIICAVHACLFINRKECLQRRMNDILIRENSHRCSHSNTIVSTECCAIRRNPFSVILHVSLNGVLLKIEDLVTVLLRHHVHVALKNDSRVVLVSRRGGFANQYISYLILESLQAE